MDFLRKIAAALNENRREWFVPALLLTSLYTAVPVFSLVYQPLSTPLI